MTLEAVWLKNGKEIAWINPVWEVENLDDCGDELGTVRVRNGYNWYRWRDVTDEKPDDFIVRVKKEN